MTTKLTPRKLKAGTFRTGHSRQMMMMMMMMTMMTRMKMWIIMMIIGEGGGVNHDDYDDDDDDDDDDNDDDDDTNSNFRSNLWRFDCDFTSLQKWEQSAFDVNIKLAKVSLGSLTSRALCSRRIKIVAMLP